MFFILVFIGDQAISFDVKTTLSMLEPTWDSEGDKHGDTVPVQNTAMRECHLSSHC